MTTCAIFQYLIRPSSLLQISAVPDTEDELHTRYVNCTEVYTKLLVKVHEKHLLLSLFAHIHDGCPWKFLNFFLETFKSVI
jgi:hypothetical protein